MTRGLNAEERVTRSKGEVYVPLLGDEAARAKVHRALDDLIEGPAPYTLSEAYKGLLPHHRRIHGNAVRV